MLLSRLIESSLGGSPVTIFGDGTHRRDFTFLEDVVGVASTEAAIGHTGSALGWQLRTTFTEGMTAQVDWARRRRRTASKANW